MKQKYSRGAESSVPTLPVIEVARGANIVSMNVAQTKTNSSKYPTGFKSYTHKSEKSSKTENPLRDLIMDINELLQSNVVELNVGGHIFATTKETILKNFDGHLSFLEVIRKSHVSANLKNH